MCGMKNNPQIRRRTTTPLVISNVSAKPDMAFPKFFPDTSANDARYRTSNI
jgi:hypothetical protein